MSSLRNAVKRITHKERSQPQSRAHMGILEKKKDYKQRAVDFHRKQDRLNQIREKAAMRNPDEFYFKMKNSQIENGQHRKLERVQQKEREDKIGVEAVRIMKDQDLSYVRMQKQKDAKKLEKLQSSLHHLESENTKRKHTVFVDSEKDAAEFDVADYFDTVPELAGRTFNRPRKETLIKAAMEGMIENEDGEYETSERQIAKEIKQKQKHAKRLAKARAAAYAEMEARAKRVSTMERAEAHLVNQKLLSGKGRKRKIKAAENGQPAQYKWRRKRAK
eukprot:CAMPEP_0202448280 /NCGR_PEP_ID=MMETSP1360-20130828/7096_1 /ASSEMBLY_ACC=CAM_ASM_000848 /TAXON_ID=515479 /ORGANISM="Licmophora paradoxa, Strain CCMP2313" /LENGTH=275 /DNA_ID=CAMNT_0049065785 /DNA_START=43 /DNA_END=870 /DNA_ORIENTATION=+